MDWNKQTEEMIKVWADAQQAMWSGALGTMPGLAKSPATQVWETALEASNTMTRYVFKAQLQWSRMWAASLASAPGVFAETKQSAREMQEMTEHWVALQIELWDNWFAVIKSFDPYKMTVSSSTSTIEGQRVSEMWQELAKKTLEGQTKWMSAWIPQSKDEK